MYIYDRKSAGPQSQRTQKSTVLRPSQIYQYSNATQLEDESLQLGSLLSAFAGPPTLAEKLTDARKTNQSKEKIFKILREQAPPFTLDSTAKAELKTIFATNADDLWLAETIAKNGPEPFGR